MSRDKALTLLKEHVKSKRLLRFSIAAETIMKVLLERFRVTKPECQRSLPLHKRDYAGYAQHSPEDHVKKTLKLSKNSSVSEKMLEAALRYNPKSSHFAKSVCPNNTLILLRKSRGIGVDDFKLSLRPLRVKTTSKGCLRVLQAKHEGA